MKKFSLIAFAVAAFAVGAHAQGFEGFGWDNGTQEVVGRLGLGGFNHVEVGVGLRFDDREANTDAKSTLSVSGRYLLALHQWEKLTGYLHLGVYFRDDDNSPNSPYFGSGRQAAALALFAGYQPEVLLLPHFAVSTLFGVAVPIMPDVQFRFTGDPVSIVSGFNFRILL